MQKDRYGIKAWVMGILLAAPAALAADSDGEWPGWRGPNRDGKSTDTGLLSQWPEAGPPLLWKVDGLGAGYSSAAVSGGSVYITGLVDGNLMIFAFDLDGKRLWSTEVDTTARRGPKASRGTPTIDDGKLYLLSGNALLGCFDAATGRQIWSSDLKQFGGKPGGWGYAESVLIYNDLAVAKSGGENCIVALDKQTGETRWTSSPPRT
jgi:outer membrane protein assembly factor BamB